MLLEDDTGTVYGLADSEIEKRFKVTYIAGGVYDSQKDIEYDLTNPVELRMFVTEINRLHNDKKLLTEVVRNPLVGLKIIDKSQKELICEVINK